MCARLLFGTVFRGHSSTRLERIGISKRQSARPATCAAAPRTRCGLSDCRATRWPFCDNASEQGASLPGFVREEFDAYLRCRRLEHGFVRAKCEGCRYEMM